MGSEKNKPLSEGRNFLLGSHLGIPKDLSIAMRFPSLLLYPLLLLGVGRVGTRVHTKAKLPQRDPSWRLTRLLLSLSFFREYFFNYQAYSAVPEPQLPQRCELKSYCSLCQHHDEIIPM